MRECKNADCGKCAGCVEERKDPVGCYPTEGIYLGAVVVVVCVFIVLGLFSYYVIFKK